jgi:copper homeostasis protein
MRTIVFELCGENIQACTAARQGGASRIELCTALSEGGMTPSHGLIREAVRTSGLPVHVMIRPRAGDFVYSSAEFEVMREDIAHSKLIGAGGIVLGILCADDSVDVVRTQELVELARPLPVTFHRAFDRAASLETALEEIISTGCSRLLTSGGEHDVVRGAKSLAKLVKQAAGRIEIAVGGGLRLENAAAVARTTGASHFHGSLRRLATDSSRKGEALGHESDSFDSSRFLVDSSDVRTMIETLLSA